MKLTNIELHFFKIFNEFRSEYIGKTIKFLICENDNECFRLFTWNDLDIEEIKQIYSVTVVEEEITSIEYLNGALVVNGLENNHIFF